MGPLVKKPWAGLERGRSYSVDITAEEVKRIFGAEPPPGAIVSVKVKVSQEADCQDSAVVRRLRSLPGGKKEK
jgi:hypothetical protein